MEDKSPSWMSQSPTGSQLNTATSDRYTVWNRKIAQLSPVNPQNRDKLLF